MRQEARYRWWRRGADPLAEPVASFTATLVFAEVEEATFRLDGLAGIPVPAGGPPMAHALGGATVAAGREQDHPRHPFSLQVDLPGDGWLAAALVTLERWTTTGVGVAVEVLRRGSRCQARMSDGAATALFDLRRADGLFWLTIGPPN